MLLQIWSWAEWFAALFTIVQLILRLGELMPFQMSSFWEWLAALCTLVQFLSSVNHHVDSKTTSLTKWFVALCTLVCLPSRMGHLVIIQVFCLVKCFLALVTIEKVLSTAVGHKGSAVGLWTQVTRICHHKGPTQVQRLVNMYCGYNEYLNTLLWPLSLSQLGDSIWPLSVLGQSSKLNCIFKSNSRSQPIPGIQVSHSSYQK